MLLLRVLEAGEREVETEAILRATFFMWKRMKIVVELTGVRAAAALFEVAVAAPGARVGVIVSGGNVDLKKVAELFA